MTQTLQRLCEWLKKNAVNKEKPGRKTHYSIPDTLDIGQGKLTSSITEDALNGDEGTGGLGQDQTRSL